MKDIKKCHHYVDCSPSQVCTFNVNLRADKEYKHQKHFRMSELMYRYKLPVDLLPNNCRQHRTKFTKLYTEFIPQLSKKIKKKIKTIINNNDLNRIFGLYQNKK